MEILIRKSALEEALAGARAAYPNEFICLLIGKRDKGNIIIEETLIPPGIMVEKSMSSFSEWMLPVIVGLMGTFHSHPNGSSLPSAADRRLFSQKGGVHLIAGYPYSEKNVSAYLGNGKRAAFRVVG